MTNRILGVTDDNYIGEVERLFISNTPYVTYKNGRKIKINTEK